MEVIMTDIATDTAKATEVFTRPAETFFKALENAQSRLGIPEAARDFAKRSVEAAKTNTDKVQVAANKASEAIEAAFSRSVGEIALVSRRFIKVAHEDATAALATVEKLAEATSLKEAVQLYVEYARERGEAGASRLTETAEYVAKTVAERANTARETFAANL